MTDDDIVTRLRDYNCRCTFVVAGVVGIVCEICEAADEIERLRAAGDALAGYGGQACECLRDPDGRLDDVCNPCKHRFAWLEARRG